MKTNNLKLFERYYNGEMDPDEKDSFEKSMSEDPELDASYQEYLSIYDAIRDKETLDLRIKLKEIREENARKRKGKDFLSQGNNWLWMAALITVIISFTIITSLLITRSRPNEQFAFETIQPYNPDYSAFDRELIKFEQRNVNFKLESPKDSIFLNRNNPILFKWSFNATDPLILELIDSSGRIVFSTVKPVESPYTIDKNLPYGIMVYRFRTETEAYSLGFLYFR
jgi:hypothetical protein